MKLHLVFCRWFCRQLVTMCYGIVCCSLDGLLKLIARVHCFWQDVVVLVSQEAIKY